MKNIIKGTNTKVCLIGKIKGISEEVKRSRSLLLKSKSIERRNGLALTKVYLGSMARHYLLAYTFLRGLPCSYSEKKHGEHNKPDANLILRLVLEHVSMYQTVKIEEIVEWLKT
jgi:hypothetical protein